MLVKLGENGVKTLEDLADCASDDLVGWTERGENGETASPAISATSTFRAGRPTP